MQTVSVPVTVVRGASNQKPELRMPVLQWPARCACCGEPNEGSTLDLRHQVYAGGGDVIRYASTTGIPMYPLAWRLPCCPSCRKHQADISGLTGGALFVGAFMLWAGIGYLLFLADLAYNAIAIVAWVALGLGLGYAVFKLYPRIDKWLKQRALSHMKPTCTASGLPVSIRSDLQHIEFAFQNDSFANEFRALNHV